MRNLLSFLILAALLSLPTQAPAGMVAAEKSATESVEDVEAQGIVGEACFGDRYESDNDINEGNRITDEELRLLLNRPGS